MLLWEKESLICIEYLRLWYSTHLKELVSWPFILRIDLTIPAAAEKLIDIMLTVSLPHPR